MADSSDRASFLSWKYRHYFSLVQIKDKNILVSCSLCAGARTLSTAKNSNYNLHKHLVKQHASTKLIAKEPSASSADQAVGATSSKQPRLDFKQKYFQSLSQTELNRLIARYVVKTCDLCQQSCPLPSGN